MTGVGVVLAVTLILAFYRLISSTGEEQQVRPAAARRARPAEDREAAQRLRALSATPTVTREHGTVVWY
jgi:hypothetical protein